MPTFSRAASKPLYDVSGSRFEDRTRFNRRLDREDDEEAGGRSRLQSQNRFGAKKFGIQITVFYGDGERSKGYNEWYRTARARDQGLDHFNRRKNLTAPACGWPTRWTAEVI